MTDNQQTKVKRERFLIHEGTILPLHLGLQTKCAEIGIITPIQTVHPMIIHCRCVVFKNTWGRCTAQRA